MEDNNGNAPRDPQLNEETERQINEIEEKVAKKKSKFWKEVKEWAVALIVAVLVVFVIQTFLFRIIRVDGHSMDTTLADGERLFVTVADVRFWEAMMVMVFGKQVRLMDRAYRQIPPVAAIILAADRNMGLRMPSSARIVTRGWTGCRSIPPTPRQTVDGRSFRSTAVVFSSVLSA